MLRDEKGQSPKIHKGDQKEKTPPKTNQINRRRNSFAKVYLAV